MTSQQLEFHSHPLKNIDCIALILKRLCVEYSVFSDWKWDLLFFINICYKVSQSFISVC